MSLPMPAIPALLSLLLLGLSACASTSPARSTAPPARDLQMAQKVPVLDLAPARAPAQAQTDKSAPLRFADSVTVSLTPDTQGQWSSWDTDFDRWRLDLHSPGAASLNLHFSEMRLPQGARLMLYAPAKPAQAVVLTAGDNKAHGAYWTPQIPGDTLRMDLLLPRSLKKTVPLRLETVNIAWP